MLINLYRLCKILINKMEHEYDGYFDIKFNETKNTYSIYIYSAGNYMYKLIAKVKDDLNNLNINVLNETTGYYCNHDCGVITISVKDFIKYVLSKKINYIETNKHVLNEHDFHTALSNDLNIIGFAVCDITNEYLILELDYRTNYDTVKSFLNNFGAAYKIDTDKNILKIFIDSANRLLITYLLKGVV